MVPIPSEESTGTEGAEPADPLRRVVHVALAIYLMPVVAIVCAIGGVSIVFDKATRLAARLKTEDRRIGDANPLRLVRSAGAGPRPSIARDRRRIRAGH